ncbi:hypothetical protein HDU92_006605, partial [Lobulomyces angularis]
MTKVEHEFRDYENADLHVSNFYKLNHEEQIYKLAKEKKERYKNKNFGKFGVWEMLIKLNQIIDDSDPDTNLSQIQHAYQAAEGARKDNQPRWLQLVCLIHDLGKVLALPPYNEPQHFVVGDTFPLGCQFSKNIVYYDFFKNNPDTNNERFNTKFGVYHENIGLDNVVMSYGHDYIPKEAAFVIRFHSFYSCHSAGDYQYLLNEDDLKNMEWVKKFNKYDLYTKANEMVDEDSHDIIKYYK